MQLVHIFPRPVIVEDSTGETLLVGRIVRDGDTLKAEVLKRFVDNDHIVEIMGKALAIAEAELLEEDKKLN